MKNILQDLIVDMISEAENRKCAIIHEVKMISKKIKAMEVVSFRYYPKYCRLNFSNNFMQLLINRNWI